jgi:hypothetical protein
MAESGVCKNLAICQWGTNIYRIFQYSTHLMLTEFFYTWWIWLSIMDVIMKTNVVFVGCIRTDKNFCGACFWAVQVIHFGLPTFLKVDTWYRCPSVYWYGLFGLRRTLDFFHYLFKFLSVAFIFSTIVELSYMYYCTNYVLCSILCNYFFNCKH